MLLLASQSRKSSARSAAAAVARRELGGGHLVEVARPDEVVRRRAQVLLSIVSRPQAHGIVGDATPRAGVALVLAGGEHQQRRVVGGGVRARRPPGAGFRRAR